MTRPVSATIIAGQTNVRTRLPWVTARGAGGQRRPPDEPQTKSRDGFD